MEEEVVKKYTLLISFACFFLMLFLAMMPTIEIQAGRIIAENKEKWEQAKKKDAIVTYENFISDTKDEEETTESALPEGTIRIPLPEESKDLVIKAENDYMNRVVTLTITGFDESLLEDDPMIGSPDHIMDVSAYMDGDAFIVQFLTEDVVEPTYEIEDGHLYLKLNNPWDIYERIVVIDAGHGGRLPGMVVGNTYEKDLTLKIVNYLKEYLEGNSAIKAYYTRTTDVDISLYDRAELANNVHANLFLSVHLNALAKKSEAGTNGTMTLYDEDKTEGDHTSYDFAKIVNDMLVEKLGSQNRGLTKGHDIYIIREANMPVALAEIGFMSNKKELELLKSDEYQQKCAHALYLAILKAFKEGY